MAHKHLLIILSLALVVPIIYGMKVEPANTGDPILPIVYVHGLNHDASSLNGSVVELKKLLPEGTPIYTPELGFKGYLPLEAQIKKLTTYVNGKKELKEGFNLLAYSQGGLVARGAVEAGNFDHRAYTLTTLASPHRGVCDLPGDWDDKADDVLERYVKCRVIQKAEEKLYKALYFQPSDVFKLSIPNTPVTEVIKKVAGIIHVPPACSIVQLWNEPSAPEAYLEGNEFLPIYNNEKTHPNTDAFRDNLGTVQKLTTVAATQDTMVTPWQSGRFDYYAKDRSTIVPVQQTPIFKALGLDTFGSKFQQHDIAETHGSIHINQQALAHVVAALAKRSDTESDTGTVYEKTSLPWWTCCCCK